MNKLRSIQKIKDLYIFGTGKSGENLNYLLDKEQIKVKGFLDNNSQKRGKLINGKVIYNPSDLSREKLSKSFIIVSSMYWQEIYEQLKEIGLLYKKDYLFHLSHRDCLYVF